MPSKASRCWSRSTDDTVECGYFLSDRSQPFYSRTYCFDRQWDPGAEFRMFYWPSESSRYDETAEFEVGIQIRSFGNQQWIFCAITFKIVDKAGTCHYKNHSRCGFRRSGRQKWTLRIPRRVLDDSTRKFGHLDANFVIIFEKDNKHLDSSSSLISPKQKDVKQESFSSRRSTCRSPSCLSKRSTSKESTDKEAVDVDDSTFVLKIPSIDKTCEFNQKEFDGATFLLRYYPWNPRHSKSTCNFEFWVVDFGCHERLELDLEWQLQNSKGKVGFLDKQSASLQKQCTCGQQKCRCKPKKYYRIQPDELRDFADNHSVKLIFKLRRSTITETTDLPRDDPQTAINITSPAISLTSSNSYSDYFKQFSYNPDALLSFSHSKNTATEDPVLTPKSLQPELNLQPSYDSSFSYPSNTIIDMKIEEEADANQKSTSGYMDISSFVHPKTTAIDSTSTSLSQPLNVQANNAEHNQTPINFSYPSEITSPPAIKPERIEIVELSDDDCNLPFNGTIFEEPMKSPPKIYDFYCTENIDDCVSHQLENTRISDVAAPTKMVNQNAKLDNEDCEEENDDKETIVTESEDSTSEESEYKPTSELDLLSSPKIRRSLPRRTYNSVVLSDEEVKKPMEFTTQKTMSGSLNSTPSKIRPLPKKRTRIASSSDTGEEEEERKFRRMDSKITIVASGMTFEVDKTALIDESLYFAKACAKNDRLTRFELEWISKDVLKAVIQWMTHKHVNDLKNRAEKLYEAADKLDMSKLKQKCVESLKETCKTENQAALYIFAVKHDIIDLQHEMSFIKRAPKKLISFLQSHEMAKLIKDKETDLTLKIFQSLG
ncbi:hypothetical protein M3Y98_00676200 [Aphelenchoides besseyi]|nr:hypothetical protein M3Y98_00676200 [Aphelenchoides besseyi]KAI6209138.1 hypothetical protein M3Y96_00189400 [Aphelenchoides besseyi]